MVPQEAHLESYQRASQKKEEIYNQYRARQISLESAVKQISAIDDPPRSWGMSLLRIAIGAVMPLLFVRSRS